MTIDVIRTNAPSVFEAELPTVAYEHAQSAERGPRADPKARRHGPIAMGPYGPEVLAYDLVRTGSRTTGSPCQRGRATGTGHHLRRAVGHRRQGAAESRRCRTPPAAAPAGVKGVHPQEALRLRTTCADIIAELVYQHAGAGRCDAVADIARQYPIPIICALLGTPREDWHLFSTCGRRHLQGSSTGTSSTTHRDIVRAWNELEGLPRRDGHPEA